MHPIRLVSPLSKILGCSSQLWSVAKIRMPPKGKICVSSAVKLMSNNRIPPCKLFCPTPGGLRFRQVLYSPMRLARIEGSKSFHIFLSVAFFSAHDLSRLGTLQKLEAGVPILTVSEDRPSWRLLRLHLPRVGEPPGATGWLHETFSSFMEEKAFVKNSALKTHR